MKSAEYIKWCLAVCLCVSGSRQFAQESVAPQSNYGFRVGLVIAYGTHFQRLGLNFNFYASYRSFQATTELRLYRNFRNLGPGGAYQELVISQAIVYGYGKNVSILNPFVTTVSNQTQLDHSIAYSFNAYFNRIGTKQQTGSLALQFNSFTFICENDILARPQLDRFRTGAFLFMYQYKDLHQFALNCSMWTGQMGKRVEPNSGESVSHCYMDSTGGKFTNCSHGLLSLQFKTMLPYQQSVQANAGIDAEQVRNVVQNKLIHDMVLLPEKWRPHNNCHIPMLDKNGTAFLNKENQTIRPAKVYINAFSNAAIFY
jgi:hypothetical protein